MDLSHRMEEEQETDRLNGLQQRLQDGTQSGAGNGQRLMDTENCPNL